MFLILCCLFSLENRLELMGESLLSYLAKDIAPHVPVLSRTESQTVSPAKSSDIISSLSTVGPVTVSQASQTNSANPSSSSGSSTASRSSNEGGFLLTLPSSLTFTPPKPAQPALMPLKKKTFSDSFPKYVPAEQEKNKEKEKSSTITNKETEPAEQDELGKKAFSNKQFFFLKTFLAIPWIEY